MLCPRHFILGHCTTLTTGSLDQLNSSEEDNEPRRKVHYLKEICYDLHIWPRDMIQGHYKLSKTLLSYRAQKKEYRVWTRIFHRIGITLTFDPKTLFKVTANPLPISPLLVKCDSDWTEGREYIFQTNILQIGLEWPLSLTQKLSLNSLQPLYPIALYMYVVADEEWSILYIIYMQVCIFIYLYLLLQTSISHTSIFPFTPEILVQGHINPLP